MTLVQMDALLLWAGAAGAGVVLGTLGHWIAPRHLAWPAVAGVFYGALCMLFGPPVIALVPLGMSTGAALLGRGWEARYV